jgi:chorismate synthase
MLRFLTAGESHGPCLTGIVDGLPAGLALAEETINHDLRRRQGGYGRGGRQSIERDQVEILGGLDRGRTTGAPLALRVANRDWENVRGKEQPAMTVPRPGHADLAGALKYGFTDLRPVAERASARETAMRVAVGTVAKALLATRGVAVYSYVTEVGGVAAEIPDAPPRQLHALAEDSLLRCPDVAAAPEMIQAIDRARESGDSLGGCFTVVLTGVPAGLGTYVQWDRRLDGLLAQAIMSIPAIKGVEIGDGFSAARLRGLEAHDAIEAEPSGPLVRPTNHAGGVEGGVSNGQPIVIRAAMKPIPTTVTPQRSVDLATRLPAVTSYVRSDVCAAPAASVVGEAMAAWVVAVALLEREGGDTL